MSSRQVGGVAGAWRLFETAAATYEEWYATPRGRRADREESALLGWLLDFLVPVESALEIGCGTGHFTRWLAARVERVVGLDRSLAMLAEARRRSPRLPLVLGDAHRLPCCDRTVDVTVFAATLEFLEEPAVALAEAVRVSRRGVLIVALNRWSLGGLSRRWGMQAQRSLLGRARDLSLPALRALAAGAAGARLRQLRWASGLFPDSLVTTPARIPFGDVIGLAMEVER